MGAPDATAARAGTAGIVAAAAGAVLLILVAGGVAESAYDYISGFGAPQQVVQAFKRSPYLSGVGLVFVEEAGIPIPVPGDVVVMYAGHEVPHRPVAWVEIWFAMLVAVMAGCSVLYLLGARFGRRMARGRIGTAMHLNEERLEKLEGWFARWGVFAVFFGRLMPGGRQPVSMAAGAFGVKFPAFFISAGLSAAVWLGAFVTVGVIAGPKAAEILGAHKTTSTVAGLAFLLIGLGYVGYRVLFVKSPRSTRSAAR